MLITTETSLSNFEFWGGAELTANELTEDDFDTIEAELEQQYPNGIDETELNDLFRHEEDTIAQYLGYADWEEFVHKDDELNLPTELFIDHDTLSNDWEELDEDEKSDIISDYLSDEYGFCHYGFAYEELSSVRIYDIEWDTTD